jgi:hypothetical protein
MRNHAEIESRSAASLSYAQRNFTIERFIERFDRSLREVAALAGQRR